jgi:hypothetical protein
VFGVMKANCRPMHPAHVAQPGAMNKQVGTAFLVRAWEEASSEVPNDAWSIYGDFDQSEH